MRTNDLRRYIEYALNSIKTEYSLPDQAITYRIASDANMYPHIVYEITAMTPTDMGREDYTVDIHVFTKDQAYALNLADGIVDLFSFNNAPQATILPTFYLVSTGNLEDPDKTICHTVVRFEVQNYRRVK